MPSGHLRNEVVSQSFQYAAELDPRRVFQLANTIANVNNLSLAEQLAYVWAVRDPLAALEETSAVEGLGARARLQEAVLRSWARYEPDEMLENIDLIPQELRQYACSRAVERPLYSDPHES